MSFDKKFVGPDGTVRPDCWESGDGKGTYKKGDVRCEGGPDPNYYNPTTRSNIRPTCKHINECASMKSRLVPATALVKPVIPTQQQPQVQTTFTPFTSPQPTFTPFTSPQQPTQQNTNAQPRTFQPLTPPTSRPYQQTQPVQQPNIYQGQVQQGQGVPNLIRPVYPGIPQQQHIPSNMAQQIAEQRIIEQQMRLQHMQGASVGASQLINHQHQMAQQAADARFVHQHQAATLGARTGTEAAYGYDISATPVQFDSLLAQHEPWAPNTGMQRFGSELARSSLTGLFMAATRFISFNPWSKNFRPHGQ